MIFLLKNKENEGKIGGRPEKEALPLLRDVNHTTEKWGCLLKERFPSLKDYLLLPDDSVLVINDCVRLLRDGFIEEDDNRLVVNDWVLLMQEGLVVLKITPHPGPHSLEPLYIFYKNPLSYYLKYYFYLYSEIRTLHYLSECLNYDLCDSFDFMIKHFKNHNNHTNHNNHSSDNG